jgi:Tol biopolymer transport system component
LVVASDGSTPPVDLGDFGGADPWTPSFSPDSSKLAVAVGDGTLWIVNRDGSDKRIISHTNFVEVGEKGSAAEWNPDGTRLLFGGALPDQDYGLYMIGLDGAPETLISARSNDGVWSPDGSVFAYMRAGIGLGPSLVIADRDGKQIRVLPGYYGWYMPAWSPDQTRVAILDDRPGLENEPGPPVIVLLDPLGKAAPVTLPAGEETIAEESSPDFTLPWQRLAP